MNNQLPVDSVLEPPELEPDFELLTGEENTDPGPDQEDPFGPRDWYNAEDRYEMIAEAAYYRAEQRGFEIGNEDLDWLEAEQELIEEMSR